MVEIIKSEIPEPIAKKFRKKAMEQYGYKKGAMKKAIQDLITRYISTGKADWKSLRGVISSDLSSVELQHNLWKRMD
ncbi:MAG: hypothetical protein QXS96_07750 [Candidatus Caldarchaeum sp.]|jgi:hypothetical protein